AWARAPPAQATGKRQRAGRASSLTSTASNPRACSSTPAPSRHSRPCGRTGSGRGPQTVSRSFPVRSPPTSSRSPPVSFRNSTAAACTRRWTRPWPPRTRHRPADRRSRRSHTIRLMTTSAFSDASAPTEVARALTAIASDAKAASRHLARLTRAEKDAALQAMAAALRSESAQVLAANARDVQRERTGGMSEAMIDRLTLTEERIAGIATALGDLAALPDPIGQVVHGERLPNGLRVRQLRVPMGVVGMIYEARPNVTVDAAGIALKSGNAVILRGGSAAEESNIAIVGVLQDALAGEGLPRLAVQSIDAHGRDGATELMRARGLVDVLIPRGGAGLIETVVTNSLVPVIETGVGNVHVYVDASADLERAVEIALNAKVQRPSVCNAAETLLVHAEIAQEFLPRIFAALRAEGVALHADEAASAFAADGDVTPATEADWHTEYLALDLAVKVVAQDRKSTRLNSSHVSISYAV